MDFFDAILFICFTLICRTLKKLYFSRVFLIFSGQTVYESILSGRNQGFFGVNDFYAFYYSKCCVLLVGCTYLVSVTNFGFCLRIFHFFTRDFNFFTNFFHRIWKDLICSWKECSLYQTKAHILARHATRYEFNESYLCWWKQQQQPRNVCRLSQVGAVDFGSDCMYMYV